MNKAKEINLVENKISYAIQKEGLAYQLKYLEFLDMKDETMPSTT